MVFNIEKKIRQSKKDLHSLKLSSATSFLLKLFLKIDVDVISKGALLEIYDVDGGQIMKLVGIISYHVYGKD